MVRANVPYRMHSASAARRAARPATICLALAWILIPHAPAAAQAPAHPSAPGGDASWRSDLLQWREQRAQKLSAPDGWLTLVGLDWLKPGENTIGLDAGNTIRLHGKAPQHLGTIVVDGPQLRLEAPGSGFPPELKMNGQPAHSGPIQADDAEPTVLTDDNLTLVVLHRGDRFALRIKDAESPTRVDFHGLNWYPPDSALRVTAKWMPFQSTRTMKIPTIIGTTLDMPSPGVAEFTIHGKTLRLQPVLEDPDAKELFFILRDTTSASTTYGAARFLYAPMPDNGLDQPGTLVLDFNRLQNPPCAYTVYATCPLPPPSNQLSVPIAAGEKRYKEAE